MVAMKLMVSVIFPSWPMQLINHENVKDHMKDHRDHLIATMMYKIVNNLIDIEASSHLIPITSGTCCHPIRYQYTYKQGLTLNYSHSFLNQSRAGRRPARDWFLEITFVRDVSMRMCVCVCPPPRLLITSGVIWCDIELL